MKSSTPKLQDYDPREVYWQYEAIIDIRRDFDYSLGTHEVLFSGAVGSGKSLPAAHIAVTHCLLYPGANYAVGRRALPQLKATALRKIKEHLFESGVDYRYNQSSGDFYLCNSSKITALSWADGNYSKLGSYEFSSGQIEEAQENKEPTCAEFLLTRMGRLPHVKESCLLYLANPDSPQHWLAKRFKIGSAAPSKPRVRVSPTRTVYFSRTEQNPFLPPQYINSLKENLDPKLARRLLYGEWVEINTERIYHAYESERNFLEHQDYTVDPRFPVRLAFDFNIAQGKPLSAVFFQYKNGAFHFFDEVVVEGFRTEDALDEMASRGLLDHRAMYVVHGDAAGKHNDTRSKGSDYDIIKKYLSNYKTRDGRQMQYRVDVPLSNPPIRKRHNLMNAHCLNDNGEVRFFVYKRCKTLDEGMRLTALKDKAQYIEDDSKPYQHITTAAGYGLNSCLVSEGRQAPTGVSR